jgi:hypothetical protein
VLVAATQVAPYEHLVPSHFTPSDTHPRRY